MSRVFEYAIEDLSKKTGYHYNFLVGMFNEMMDDEGQDFDWDQFEGISMEHDWWNYELWCEQNGYTYKSPEAKTSHINTYTYNGPVLEFDRVIADHWNASTRAESEKKARCNLAYQFKMQSGRTPQSNITIPGKLNIIEGDEQHSGGNRH